MDFLAYNAFLFVVYFFSWARVTPFTGPSRAPDFPEEVTRKLKKGSQWKKSSAPEPSISSFFKVTFDSPIGGHLSPEKVTYWFKRGHFEEPGCWGFQNVSCRPWESK